MPHTVRNTEGPESDTMGFGDCYNWARLCQLGMTPGVDTMGLVGFGIINESMLAHYATRALSRLTLSCTMMWWKRCAAVGLCITAHSAEDPPQLPTRDHFIA